MPETDPSRLVANAELLMQRFGRWPDLHDAEIARIVLDREGTALRIQIKVATTSTETDETGYFKRTNPSLVTLQFREIDDLELIGFNQQNVIWDITFDAVGARIIVTIHSTFGLGGRFSCERAEVAELVPLDSW